MAPGIADRVWSGVRHLAEGATGGIDSRLNEHRIRLAVTGLSRAGKTVFITSLIQNLLALGGARDTLPLVSRRLALGGRNRLRRVRLLPAGTETMPYFDFRANLARLAAEHPVWPEPTRSLAQISLALEVEHVSGLRQRLGSKRIRLDILDYPGEWLLDLPLLERSFADWSDDTLAAMRQAPRQQHAAAFLDFLQAIAAGDRADEAVVRQGHLLYRAALEGCREGAGLRYLQPGRFLCPGPHGDAPFLWFFPLPLGAATPAPGSVGALLRDRFDTYKRQVRADFFDTHFRQFDRQIMLVDVLGALYAGEVAFADTGRAILDLAIGLRDGWGFWARRRAGAGDARAATRWASVTPVALATAALSSVMAPRPVERVAFVATKADHVPPPGRTNLKALLAALAEPAAESWSGTRARVSYHVAAAVRSTEDGTAPIGDRGAPVVKGIVLGEDKVRPFYVGQVPSELPPPAFWTGQYFALPVFRPPVIDASGAVGIPHLGLDEVLDAVIGDLL